MISIIIPTLGRESLYPLIDNLLKQKTGSSFEIILIPQVKLKKLPTTDKIKIYSEKPKKGFAYYRNVGIKKSKGDIIVFIDDDELPMNERWLDIITKPIIDKKEKVVTAGVSIKLGQGYFTDCISLLGFPGGGAVGFEIMWPLKNPPYTDHLCSGNLAINKKVLNDCGNFDNSMKSGNEDVNLADKLISKNIKILYQKEATIYHEARKGYLNFIKWNVLRGKSAKQFLKQSKAKKKLTNRVSSSIRILKKIAEKHIFHLPGVIFMMINQYFWQGVGYIWGR